MLEKNENGMKWKRKNIKKVILRKKNKYKMETVKNKKEK